MNFKSQLDPEVYMSVTFKSDKKTEDPREPCDLNISIDCRDESITAISSSDKSLTFRVIDAGDSNDQNLPNGTNPEPREYRVFSQETNLNISNINKVLQKSNSKGSVFERLSNSETKSSRSLKSPKETTTSCDKLRTIPPEKITSKRPLKQIPKDKNVNKILTTKIIQSESLVPVDQLISRFDALTKLREDIAPKMKNSISSRLEENTRNVSEHHTNSTSSDEFGEIPMMIEFETVMRMFLQDGYKSDCFNLLNAQELDLNEKLVDFSNDKITSKGLACEIIHSMFKQDLPNDCKWDIGSPMTREIVSPIGERGYCILIEASELDDKTSKRISSATGRVYFVYECNEIQIESYSFICNPSG